MLLLHADWAVDFFPFCIDSKLVWPHNSNNRITSQTNRQLLQPLPWPLLPPPLLLLLPPTKHKRWFSPNGMLKNVIDSVSMIRIDSKRTRYAVGAQNQNHCATIGEDGNVQRRTVILALERSKSTMVSGNNVLVPFIATYILWSWETFVSEFTIYYKSRTNLMNLCIDFIESLGENRWIFDWLEMKITTCLDKESQLHANKSICSDSFICSHH